MTVTYSLSVSNACFLGFPKLLLRWRGSIYKLLYKEMLVFCLLYYILSCTYRYVLNPSQQELFEHISEYCKLYVNRVPISLILGFYLTFVIHRWWQQFQAIQLPDKLAMLISAYVDGYDERSTVIRRTLARYLSLLFVLTLQAISVSVKRRFPTVEHLIESGLMTKEEKIVYDEIKLKVGKWWIPAQWFTSLACRAFGEGRIKSYHHLLSLLDELQIIRGKCGSLFDYDFISIPLVYTQIVTVVIYTYFVGAAMGRQSLNLTKNAHGYEFDFYFPVFVILEFFFYMGLLKVAEQLINPFGQDDDDFEANLIIDRHLQMTLAIVDGMHDKLPILTKDAFWDEPMPQLPYTRSTVKLRSGPHLGSAVNIHVTSEESEFVPMETIKEVNDEDENQSLTTSVEKLQSTLQSPFIIFSPEHSLSKEIPDMKIGFNSACLHSKITNTTDEQNGEHLSDSTRKEDTLSLFNAIAKTSSNSVCEENHSAELQFAFGVKEQRIVECEKDLECLIHISTGANLKDSTPPLMPIINAISTSRSVEVMNQTQSENIDSTQMLICLENESDSQLDIEVMNQTKSENIDSKQMLICLENESDIQLDQSSYGRNSLQDSRTFKQHW